MPRELIGSNDNKATFIDGVSNSEVTLCYRTPTNKERIDFKAAVMVRRGKKIIDQSVEAQLFYGVKVLTGIKEGDFLKDGQPISSDENSEHYDPDWKKLVLETAGDLVQSLALLVFSAVVLKYEGSEKPDSEDEKGLDMSEILGDESDEPSVSEEAEEKDSPLE